MQFDELGMCYSIKYHIFRFDSILNIEYYYSRIIIQWIKLKFLNFIAL